MDRETQEWRKTVLEAMVHNRLQHQRSIWWWRRRRGRKITGK
jgi:hypothetical protein